MSHRSSSVDATGIWQPLSAVLTSISANTGTAADKGIYFTALNTAAEFDLTAAGRAILDDADASAQRATLGLGTMSTQDANNVAITGGTISGITDLAIADGGTNSSAALTNGLMMSSIGGAIVESAILESELETLTDSSDAGSLHIHDARYFTETELGATTVGASGCSLIGSSSIGTPTFPTICDRMSLFNSTGRCSGGGVTDAGSENLSIASGTGFIKALDVDTAELSAFDWIANASVATTTDSHQYVGIVYNAGTPITDIRSSNTYDLDTEFPLASVVNENGTLHILENPWWVTDGITNVIERFNAQGYIVRDNNVGGLITSVPGTRNLAVSSGTLWSNLNEFEIPEIDTSTAKVASHSAVFDVDNGASKGTITASAGTPYTVLVENEYIAITGTGDNDGTYKIETITGGNVITMTTVISGTDGTEAATVIHRTFEYYSYDGVAGTWSDSHETQYSVTLWNDTTMAALQTIGNNKYVNMWVYAEADDTEFSMVYGQAEYVSAAGAEAEAPPTLIPLHIQEHAILIGRILIKQAVDAPVQVDTTFETTFSSSQAADHGNLAGLSDDDHPQYLLADGTRKLAGNWDMDSKSLTNVNVDSGVITGITALLPADGGTGESSYVDGEIMIGNTVGNTLVKSTITAGAGVAITNGPGSIAISSSGAVDWSVVTGATNAAVNSGYFCNHGAVRVVVTLPDTAAVGDVLRIAGIGAAGWEVAQNAGEKIYADDDSTTAGITGYLRSTGTYDCIELICFSANTDWLMLSSSGNITIA